MNFPKENLRIQRLVVIVAVLLFAIKAFAYYLTGSVAILTDALESTINIAAGLIGLYSLYISSKPSDQNHPYGHGKAEFLSAAVEGTMIAIAGLIIFYKAIDNFIHPQPIRKLDYGIVLVGLTAAVNYYMGWMSVRSGEKNNSLALVASGKHLQSDTYSTIGIIIGLILIYFTNRIWLDSTIAIVFAFIIVYTGYKILRRSIAGIMDETDTELLTKVVKTLNDNRRENWIDMHNLRIIKFGGQLHIDCHLTVPWYLNINEGHNEIDLLIHLIKQQFGDAIEFFVHSDGCLYSQCSICYKQNCPVRQHAFEKRIEWTTENIQSNKKHSIA